jgi:hypothetical protein
MITDGATGSAKRLTVGSGRFEIDRRLGAGGMGVVYSAWDRERGMAVAIKTLADITPEALVRLKGEFRSLRDVHHANLVELGELINDGERWFFTMELVSGIDFLSWVRPCGQLDADRLKDAVAELCLGVDFIHSLGKVHRDLKPSNVLVTAEGRVVVLDFGLVVDARTSSSTPTGGGTPGYIPPERALGHTADAAADWFAVGVMLHQALTGRHPYLATVDHTSVTRELSTLAPPNDLHPDEALTRGPLPDLGELCIGLLQADPARRPASDSILQRLGVRTRHRRSRRLVGRSQELAALAAAYGRSCAGSFAPVVIEGTSGVGKTSLVEHFVEGLDGRQPRPLVLTGRCSARESVPFKALDEAIDAVARHLASLPETERRQLFPPEIALLARSFPSLAGLTPSLADDSEPSQSAAQRDVMFSALRALMGSLAARGPVVLVTEDMQWADADSLAALAAVLEPRPPILFICTLRTRDSESLSLPTWLAQMPRLRLAGLAPSEGEALAASLLEGDASIDQGAVARAIARDADGMPLFIDVLTSWARERGAYRGASLDAALTARIGALPPPVRELLAAVGLAGGPIPLGVAEEASSFKGAALSHTLAALETANLVRTTGMRLADPVEIFHDRVRAPLLSCLTAGERRAGHRRLAMALEASSGAMLESLSFHWRKGGDPSKAGAYAVRAADEAHAALAFDRAARLYRVALRLHRFDPATAQRLRERRADALAFAGRKRAAALAYREAARYDSPERAARLRRRSGEEQLKAGYIDDGMSVLRDALAGYGVDPPRTPGRAALAIGWNIARLRLRGLGFRPRAETEIPRDRLDSIDVCQEIGRYMSFVDPALGVWLQLRALLLALAAGEPRRIALALASVTSFMSALGGSNARLAEQWWQIARSIACGIDQPYVHGVIALAKSLIDFHEGRFQQADAQSSHAVEMFEAHGAETVWEMTFAHGYRFSAMLRMGDAGTMIREVTRLLDETERRGDLYGHNQLGHWPAGMAWLYADDPARARRLAVDSVSWFRANSHHATTFLDWLDVLLHANIDLYAGDAAAGLARVNGAWSQLEKARVLSFPMALKDALDLRGRCALAAVAVGVGDQPTLLASVDADAAAMRRKPASWASPLADLLQGSAAASRGERAPALALIERSTRGFESAAMGLHAASARMRQGQLLGGIVGDEICARASAELTAVGVVNPSRIVQMLAPGRFGAPAGAVAR